jgi:hypothetical protein
MLLAGVLQALGAVLLILAACLVAVPLGVAVAGLFALALGYYVEHR